MKYTKNSSKEVEKIKQETTLSLKQKQTNKNLYKIMCMC